MTIHRHRRRMIGLSLAALSLVGVHAVAAAQAQSVGAAAADSSGVVTGRIRDRETDQPISFARATLDGGPTEVLANRDGSFRIQGILSGRHLLVVRQIGFVPEEVVVVVGRSTGRQDVLVTLRHIAIDLDTVRVVAGSACTVPGSADTGNAPTLRLLFEQVAANVEQNRAIARRYPVTLIYLRRRWQETDMLSVVQEKTDSVIHRPTDAPGRPYTPGEVITGKVDSLGHESLSIALPGIGVVSAPAFLDHHCFRYAGVDSLLGHKMYRIDFVPTADVQGPDVDGTIYLDTQSFMLRRVRIHLVNLPKEVPFRDLEATATFRDIAPFFTVNDSLETTQQMVGLKQGSGRDRHRHQRHCVPHDPR